MSGDVKNRTEEPTCRCGHTKRHFWIRPAYHYGLWGSFLAATGISVVPDRIDLRCGVCDETVETITDPVRLRRYRDREPRPEER